MDHFSYQNGTLTCEDVPLSEIARTVGTPVYVYSSATLERHFSVFDQAFAGADHMVCYAVKANSNQAVLATLARMGAGADVVSGGELLRALKAGIAPEKIVFSGVGKTEDEMRAGLKAGICQFNVESEAELVRLGDVAASMQMTAPVSIRVNPDVDAKTHEKISTGKSENKFGIPWKRADAIYQIIADTPSLSGVGVDVHIGSQLTDLAPFRSAYERVAELVAHLRSLGHPIEHVDLGGGLGIPYDPDSPVPPAPTAYADMVKDVFKDLGCKLIFEPGRMIAGNAGVLLSELLYAKMGEERTFYILDAAMNDLARPAMYDAYHSILPVTERTTSPDTVADFVGPVCETGDTFARKRATHALTAGELVVLRSAGAYGAVMASTYNSRPLVPEVLVRGGSYHVIRKRQSVEELIGLDSLPDWLA